MTELLYAWSPPRKRTDGDLAAEYVSTMSLRGRPYVMDTHQRAILDDIYAEGDEVGVPTSFDVTIVGPRQATGKTGALITAGIFDMFVVGVDRHVWTAHLDRTVRGTFREMRSLIASDPEKQALCKWPPTTGNGQRAIELRSGPMIEFFTRSEGGGRGEVGPRITYDEALYLTDDDLDASMPTMATIVDAQVRLASSGGLSRSKVLRRYRDKGRAGSADPLRGDPRSSYRELAVPPTACASDGCEHLDVEDPGCALNDRELWRRWIPMARLTEARLVDFRRNMSPAGFMREFYTWWDEPTEGERAINEVAWNARGVDPESPAALERLDPVAISVECDKAQSMTTVVAAARRGDGKTRVQIVARKHGTTWLVEYVLERNAKHRPAAVVVDPGGPAGFLIAKLQAAGVKVTTLTPRELGQASSDVVSAVKEGGLLHTRQPVLTSAALLVGLRDLGESTVFDRDNDKGDVSPIVGAALALHGLSNSSKPGLTRVVGRVSGS